eukprot:PhF_6_TR2289/c0_g1_i1/m.3984
MTTPLPRVLACISGWVVIVVYVLLNYSEQHESVPSSVSGGGGGGKATTTVGIPAIYKTQQPTSSLSKHNVDEEDTKQSNQKPPTSTPPAKVVHHILDLAAQRRNLANEFLTTHCKKCRVPDGWTTPSFCDSKRSVVPSVTHHFSKTPVYTTEEAAKLLPEKLSLVLCAIGTRFYGPGGQSYVWYNIMQFRLFNPPEEVDIYLALTDSIAQESNVTEWASRYQVTIVKESELKTEDWERYLQVFYIQGYMHPGGSRETGNKNFNKHVSERFYTLLSVIQKFNLVHVLHLENDIMVYTSWKSVITQIVRCDIDMATTVPHLKGFIPGIIYIRDAAALKKLTDFITSLLSCGTAFGKSVQPGYANDMTYTMNFYQYYGSQSLYPLPAWEHAQGENCLYDVNPGMLWDAASFGQWYSFTEPGQSGPKQHIRNSMKGRFLDATPPPLMTWEKDALGRKYPKWKNYKLLCLHVHAKNLWRFLSK